MRPPRALSARTFRTATTAPVNLLYLRDGNRRRNDTESPSLSKGAIWPCAPSCAPPQSARSLASSLFLHQRISTVSASPNLSLHSVIPGFSFFSLIPISNPTLPAVVRCQRNNVQMSSPSQPTQRNAIQSPNAPLPSNSYKENSARTCAS